MHHLDPFSGSRTVIIDTSASSLGNPNGKGDRGPRIQSREGAFKAFWANSGARATAEVGPHRTFQENVVRKQGEWC